MGFFSRRRKRESAIPESANAELGAFAASQGKPVVGQQVPGAQLGSSDVASVPGMTEGLAALAQLGPMIQQAIASGNVQITQGQPEVLDMRGSGLREEILGIMGQHGIDAESPTAGQNIDAAAYGDMQQQILEALSKHGIDAGASGTSIDFQQFTDGDPKD